MKTFKVGFVQETLNDKGERYEKFKEIDIEAQEITTDKSSNLVLKKDNHNIAIFSRNIWEKVIEKK